MKLVVISGRSGSGKSIALQTLEDLNYYVVDNLPVNLITNLVDELSSYDKLAISIDIRNINQSEQQIETLLQPLQKKYELFSIFLDAKSEILLKRYSESRRIHPLASRFPQLDAAIDYESELLNPLKKMANCTIDTTELNLYQLRDTVTQAVSGKLYQPIIINVTSFGFKYGQPNQADFVFDVRFLPNPHWVADLRPFTGNDVPIIDYLRTKPEVNKLILQLENLFISWMGMLEKNNRSYVNIAIGCTGGKHRSVFVANELARTLARKFSKHSVNVSHRELS